VSLSFDHPGSGERVTFESSYPDDLQQALEHVAA
jgi:23S rRNA pseudouridine1911/1915/1917 synthase